MTDYKELLDLYSLGISKVCIAERCGWVRITDIAALQRTVEQGHSWSEAETFSAEDGA